MPDTINRRQAFWLHRSSTRSGRALGIAAWLRNNEKSMRRARVLSEPVRARDATRVILRLRFAGHEGPLGPGKVELLEAIDRCGSISAAGRTLFMSYHYAWTLVNAMNAMFREPLVRSQPGGAKGGGAVLTALGHAVIRSYRSMESKLREHAAADIEALEAALADT